MSAGLTLVWRAATMPAIGCPDPGEKTSQPWARRMRVNRRESVSTLA